ncbi:MAG: hypothetical protein L0387_32580 [Acidobacteria bacterium]|nr:hypothetical protein [Acidobacteriota bacterium]MCI0626330.1 hypothetical protein [Acidobacteriota bacterium]MCI0718515.1 hypothetical protein [Acidobacteriota bacterium]
MFDKIRYALTLFDSTEIFILFAGLIVYHLVILLFITMSVRASAVLRLRSLEAERDEYKKNWQHRDEGWKDREEGLRRILSEERERQVSQLKAEYDSYIGLLEQKLTRTKTRETGMS